MRHALHGDGFQTWISENDFIVTAGGGIAVVGGLHIRLQQRAHRGQAVEKTARQTVRGGGHVRRRVLL